MLGRGGPCGRIIPKLLAVPGVHRGQIGIGEARLWFACNDDMTLAAVARIIRPRCGDRRRPGTRRLWRARVIGRRGASPAQARP
jgi:hypothetical protein